MSLTIRPAAENDLPILNKLGYYIYRAHFGEMWRSESELNQFLHNEYSPFALKESLQDPSTCWFLAETDQPVGFAKLSWDAGIPGTALTGVLLNKLYLSPDETGKNYGQQMFESFVRLARSRGKTFFWLEVLEKNERACQFYLHQGMRHIKDTLLTTASQQSVLKIMGMRI